MKQLQGFRRLCVEPGQSAELNFSVDASALAIWDVTRERYCVEAGDYTLMIGATSADVRLTGNLALNGETIPPRSLMEVTKAFNYDDYEGVLIDMADFHLRRCGH